MAWLSRKQKLSPFSYTIDDLQTLDGYYETMFRLHEDVHRAIADDIAKDGNSNILEVACGAGWSVPKFRSRGLHYTGIDICETAIAACALKFSDIELINLSIERTHLLQAQSFDVVYSSSMLEHIGKFEDAIAAMWRLAGRRMDLMFFEGLSDDDDHAIKFFPYDQTQHPKTWGGEYGMKVALQDHGLRDGRTSDPVPGYFYSRYSKARMTELLSTLPSSDVEIRTMQHANGDRSWVTVRRMIDNAG